MQLSDNQWTIHPESVSAIQQMNHFIKHLKSVNKHVQIRKHHSVTNPHSFKSHNHIYLQATPTNAQVASSCLLIPSVGAMGSPSSHASVLLQQSAETPSNKSPQVPLTDHALPIHQQGYRFLHLPGRYSNSLCVEVVIPVKLLEVSVLIATLFILQCISPQSLIFRLLLDVKETHFLFRKTFGNLV